MSQNLYEKIIEKLNGASIFVKNLKMINDRFIKVGEEDHNRALTLLGFVGDRQINKNDFVLYVRALCYYNIGRDIPSVQALKKMPDLLKEKKKPKQQLNSSKFFQKNPDLTVNAVKPGSFQFQISYGKLKMTATVKYLRQFRKSLKQKSQYQKYLIPHLSDEYTELASKMELQIFFTKLIEIDKSLVAKGMADGKFQLLQGPKLTVPLTSAIFDTLGMGISRIKALANRKDDAVCTDPEIMKTVEDLYKKSQRLKQILGLVTFYFENKVLFQQHQKNRLHAEFYVLKGAVSNLLQHFQEIAKQYCALAPDEQLFRNILEEKRRALMQEAEFQQLVQAMLIVNLEKQLRQGLERRQKKLLQFDQRSGV